MNISKNIKPLGKTLQEAGLISKPQLEVALYDLFHYQEMRIGEILASRGWIKSATADFFAEEWQKFIQQSDKYPLGFYLQKAGLLDYKQTESILKEQPHCLVRFGSLAVIKGWVKQETLDFFLNYLFPNQAKQSPFIQKFVDPITIVDQATVNRKNSAIQEERNSQETILNGIDYEDIPWID